MRRAALQLAFQGVQALVVASAAAGVRSDHVAPLSNAGFDAGLSAWSQSSPSGAVGFQPSSGPLGGEPSVRIDLPPGAGAQLWQTLPVQGAAGTPPGLGAPGEKLELGARVWIGAPAQGGQLWLELEATVPGGPLLIARSPVLDVGSAPKARWLWLHTQPLAALTARLPEDATHATVRVRVDGAGPVWIDRVLCGRFEYGEWTLDGADFEGGVLAPAWTTTGSARAPLSSDAYRGRGYLELSGGAASARQAVALDGPPGTPAPRRVPEACAWLYVEGDAPLPTKPKSTYAIDLEVLAWEPGSPWSSATLVAQGKWLPTAAQAGRWVFLETVPRAALPLERSHVVVRVAKSFGGTVRADFVQLGERHGVDGNPKKHVTAHFVGRYRSPLSRESVTATLPGLETWRNWAWTEPPACDAGHQAWFHQPDCAASPGCFRLNGRRDAAVSLEAGLDELPLVGAYDSRDRNVLRYQVQLARAIGLDSFTYLHQGHTLAQQTAALGREPLNEQVWEALLDVAEEPRNPFKVAVMYEPKVHLLGWVQGQPTLAAKKAGIEADLVHLLDTYGDRKAVLKRDGRMVVYVFRNDVCDPSGQQCLDDGDWLEIRQVVEQASGRGLYLVADVPPAQRAFDGLSRWELVGLPLLRYRTWTQAAAGQPAWPAPTAADARAHADALQAVATDWAAEDDRARLAIGIAWPGFDDTGVGGWSSVNLLGIDGAPLCVRVSPDLGGALFASTLASAFDAGLDWVQVASWNDWNERTQVEPRWRRAWADAVLAGIPAPASATLEVFDRARQLQGAIARFKRGPGSFEPAPERLEDIAAWYLRRARKDPAVVEYD